MTIKLQLQFLIFTAFAVTLLVSIGANHVRPSLDSGRAEAAPSVRCDRTWSIISSSDEAFQHLDAVDALSPSEIWAVGDTQPTTGGVFPLTKRWNGETWEAVPAPSSGTTTALFDVDVISSDDVWAVGTTVDRGGTTRGLTMHWNGVAWSIVPSPNVAIGNTFLYSVAAISTSDVWAVGGAPSTGPIAIHWDGSNWSSVAIANPPAAFSALGAVDARSTNDVWAVGFSASSGSLATTLIQHWDGSSWQVVPSPSRPSTFNQLRGVAIASKKSVWAVGHSTNAAGKTETLVEHWDGKSWEIVASPNSTDPTSLLIDVAAEGHEVWAVGYTMGNTQRSLMTRWNGHAWVFEPTQSKTVGTYSSLWGIARVPKGREMWAVGDQGSSTIPLASLTEQWCRRAAHG